MRPSATARHRRKSGEDEQEGGFPPGVPVIPLQGKASRMPCPVCMFVRQVKHPLPGTENLALPCLWPAGFETQGQPILELNFSDSPAALSRYAITILISCCGGGFYRDFSSFDLAEGYLAGWYGCLFVLLSLSWERTVVILNTRVRERNSALFSFPASVSIAVMVAIGWATAPVRMPFCSFCAALFDVFWRWLNFPVMHGTFYLFAIC